MAIYTMENDEVIVSISEHASEIVSFKDKKTGTEHMWQGDATYWAGRNPTLFPIVGSTWDKEIHLDGKTYHMGNHGFTRNSDFTCIQHDDSNIVMELKDSEETLKQYPFEFTLDIHYELQGSKLVITYDITNRSDKDMPFNFGLHPAFNCPMQDDEKQSDYKLVFSNKEVYPEGITSTDGYSMNLDRELLEKTIILHNPKSSYVTLTNGKHGVKVDVVGYEWLAFWSSKNNAPFVCIEPWHSHTDFEKVEVPFDKREGTMILAKNRTFTTSYAVTIF